jgi:hypothetical protein
MCEAFLRHAQKAPDGSLGKSILFAVNQTHATSLTKILNAIQPNTAVTVTSRVPEASTLAKDFRDGKRPERVAVSVDMLSTGYNCRDLLKLVLSYGVPAPTPAFVYGALGKRPLPTREQVVADTVDSLAARFNLRYREQQWLTAAAQLVADDPAALKRFLAGDMTLFTAGLKALTEFADRDAVFEALRQSALVRQSALGGGSP